ncbi:hypothetical protein ACFSTE_10440 [Aquimarina hainanensis]|uniref:Uncharacterized protein n=1 Tax=Aquimarina hainanensis TaxID=1578017 RepID=A0ABW5N6Q6_9FLAO|nr:hypothetical protein [Aquimarina sp. TRL1]QKX05733.1 hypothetical protein HN014_12705 [Aquimarina sp. TRL1]
MKTSIELQQANIQLRTILRGTIKRSLNNSLENQREVDLTRKKLKGSLRAAHSHALFQIQTTYKNLFYSKRDLSNYISSYFTNTVDKEIQWFFNNKTKKNQSSVSKPEDDYRLNKDGSIELIKTTNDNFDRLLDSESVQIGTVNKGFLSDGLNIRNKGLYLDVLNKKDFHSYINLISDLSIAVDKEIGGFIFDDYKNFDNIYITPYKENKFNSAPSLVSFINNGKNFINRNIYKIGYNFERANSWFHTHPGIIHAGYGNARPSQGDINFTKKVGVPGVILGGWNDLGFIRKNGKYDIWKN